MELYLPFESLLQEPARILILGMGGGFDVFCGLPIYFELQRRGHEAHLGSVSFAALRDYEDGEWLSDTLVGVGPAAEEASGYHPERFLSRWFLDAQKQPVTIWCFDTTGPLPLLENLQRLSDRIVFNAVVLVDGGVDSLTRGDEELCGTVMEDYISLTALSMLDKVPTRLVASIGMGIEGDVCHAQVFQNIAEVTAATGFLGTAALLPQSEAFRKYEQALTYVHEQPGQQPSVINASILSSARGNFGDYHLTERTRGSRLWISPLMSLYWFFTLDAVAGQNLFVERLKSASTAADACGIIYETRESMKLRGSESIPLS